MAFDRLASFGYALEIEGEQRAVVTAAVQSGFPVIGLPAGRKHATFWRELADSSVEDADSTDWLALHGAGDWQADSAQWTAPNYDLARVNVSRILQAWIDRDEPIYLAVAVSSTAGTATLHWHMVRESDWHISGAKASGPARPVAHGTVYQFVETSKAIYDAGPPWLEVFGRSTQQLLQWAEVVSSGASSYLSISTGADIRRRRLNVRTPYDSRLLSADFVELDGERYRIVAFTERGLRRFLEFDCITYSEAESG